jgi:cell division septum initiation protein DivIVA
MADDRNAPLTKGDLLEALNVVVTQLRQEIKNEIAQLRAEMKQEIAQLRAEMKQEIAQLRAEAQHQYDHLMEAIRDSQTEALKAFYSYAQTTDIKLKDSAAADASLRERVAIIESRLLEVERRLLMPPQS